MHLKVCMARMANDTAEAAAATGSGIQRAHATPKRAERPCPASTGHGWERAPWGTAKTSTALAPIEATKPVAAAPPTAARLIQIRTSIETKPPSAETIFSLLLTGLSSKPSRSLTREAKVMK
jgi:hypothetical protein